MRRSLFQPRGCRLSRAAAGRLASLIVILVTLVWSVGPRASAADDPEGPVGIFDVTLTKDDVPTSLPGGPDLIGQWHIEFDDDGTYTFERADVGVVVSGEYTTTGATVTLTDGAGVLACGGADAESGEATYAFKVESDTLTLSPIEEKCDLRRVLLSTRELGGSATCDTAPSAADATPDTVGTPESAVDEGTPQPVDKDQSATDQSAVEQAIDDLLLQATGCWSTGDPDQFLPLHSKDVLDEIASQGPLDEFTSQLADVMTTPLTFERVGNIKFTDDTHATAYVVVKLGEDELPLRFKFVVEDGRWLLDSFFLFDLAG
jgi:hypothetical protein